MYRADLTVQERAAQIKEWVSLTKAEKPGQIAQVSDGRGDEGGISAASCELGIKRTEVQRAVQIAATGTCARASLTPSLFSFIPGSSPLVRGCRGRAPQLRQQL